MHDADSYATLIEELELAAEHVSGQYEKFLEMRRRYERADADDEMAIAAPRHRAH